MVLAGFFDYLNTGEVLRAELVEEAYSVSDSKEERWLDLDLAAANVNRLGPL